MGSFFDRFFKIKELNNIIKNKKNKKQSFFFSKPKSTYEKIKKLGDTLERVSESSDDEKRNTSQKPPLDDKLQPDTTPSEKQPESVKVNEALVSLVPTLFLGFIAGFLFYASSLHLSVEPDIILIVTSIALTFGIYLTNRYTDHEEDMENRPDETYYLERKIWPLITALLFVAGCGIILHSSGRFVYWHAVLIVVSGILYNFKIIPIPFFKKKLHFIYVRIKEIVLIKNIVVSFMWSCTAYIILMQYKGISFIQRPDCLVVIVCLFVCSMVNAMTSDIDDIPGDSKRKINTFATLFGAHGTYIFLYILSIVSFLFLEWFSYSRRIGAGEVLYFTGNISWAFISTSPYVKKICPTPVIKEIVSNSEGLMCAITLALLSIW